MNTRMLARAFAVVLGSVCFIPESAAAQQSACWQPEGAADYILSTVRHIVSSPDTAEVGARSVFQLPEMPADSVSIVTSDSVCQSFFAVSDSLLGPGETTTKLLLLRAGPTRWILYHGYMEGGMVFFYVYDENKAFLMGVSI